MGPKAITIVLMIAAGTVFTTRKYRRSPENRQVLVETFKDKRALAIGALALGVNLLLARRAQGGMGAGLPGAVAGAAIVVAVAHLLLKKRTVK